MTTRITYNNHFMAKKILIAVICLISINAKAQSLTGNEFMDAYINELEENKKTLVDNWERPYKRAGVEIESDIYYSKKSRSIVQWTRFSSKKIFSGFTTAVLSSIEKSYFETLRAVMLREDPSGETLNEFVEAVKETEINYRWIFVYKDKSVVEITDTDEILYYLGAFSK